jgi:hypothetical protein
MEKLEESEQVHMHRELADKINELITQQEKMIEAIKYLGSICNDTEPDHWEKLYEILNQ